MLKTKLQGGMVISIGTAQVHILSVHERSVTVGIEAPPRVPIETYIRDDLAHGPLPARYRAPKLPPEVDGDL